LRLEFAKGTRIDMRRLKLERVTISDYGDLAKLLIGGIEVITSARVLQNVNADAGIITSGRFPLSRMPTAASGVLKAKGTDTDPAFEDLVADDIPDLDASKITSGVLGIDRIPSIPYSKLDAIDTPSDGEVPSYNSAQDKFEWKTVTGGLDPELSGIFWFHDFFLSSETYMQEVSDTAGISFWDKGVELYTGTTYSSVAILYKRFNVGHYSPDDVSEGYPIVDLTWSKKRKFKCRISGSSYGLPQAHGFICMGHVGTGPTVAPDTTLRHVGFEIDGNYVYASVADGTSRTTDVLINDLDYNTILTLEAELDPTAGKATFNVLKEVWDATGKTETSYSAQITTNLPADEAIDVSDRSAGYVLYVRLQGSTGDYAAGLSLAEWLFIQYP